MVQIKQNLVSADKYGIKCPYSMSPIGITIHNTANKASAANEIAYMIRNNKQTSFHYAVDDIEIIQGIPENRNAWHAGDGNGDGNRKTIAIEICYSTGDKTKFEKAQENAAEFAASLLKKYGWTTANLYTHKHWSGKHCPHRTLDEYGWDFFVNLVKKYLGEVSVSNQMYRVRKSWADAASQIGAFTNLDNAKRACKDGYYVFDSKGNVVYPEQKQEAAPTPAPTKKSVQEIAAEVWAGKWGNGTIRKQRLEAAGYNYNEVQKAVAAYKKTPTPTPAKKSNAEIAKEVWAGKWGNGADRRKRLEAAGYNYAAVQAEVEKIKTTSNGYRVQVTAGALNVRAGAGTGYRIVKVVHKGEIYTIIQTSGGWGKLSDGSGWISLAYTKKV